MHHVSKMTVVIGLMFVSTRGFAVDPSQPATPKRQMIAQINSCMKKRMYADQALSYNAAAKICKNQLAGKSDAVSVALVASDTPTPPKH
jgi:hypothetical protein